MIISTPDDELFTKLFEKECMIESNEDDDL